jgi:hypothetical protein
MAAPARHGSGLPVAPSAWFDGPVDERRDPVGARGAGTGASSRDLFAELAKRRPRPPRLRNVLWIAVGALVVAVTAAQVLGLVRNPVEARIRDEVAGREAVREARAREESAARPTAPRFDDAVPFPEGLPRDVAASLEAAFGVASKSDLEVAGRTIARLPALAAAAPEDRRREVRAFVLRRLEPLLRAGVDAPLAAEARAAAAAILDADPASDPGAPR